MNSKQYKVLKKLFENPVSATLRWTDIKQLTLAVGGIIKQGGGSRIRIVLRDRALNIHTPHPRKELKPYQIRAVRRLFKEGGIIP
ncbi:MAG: hypothetical protein COA71_03250 [SAR86 cluster bacterium]|uniref:Type II toxin-antitoxin system HicA family toxin n=1 Tax=SAR86 cluster bacterium TaxID=2030880 RepID=A0A2A5CFJ3_9GAMM|nr:MAG: hypothetical protein COA71_03250 [SAR86 cluster bacterium]